ncbi:MAG: FAD-binding oxidoreductase [Actinobacteria bacterium]|nr:FAD-binding oxidoreductase [Actinomycetota bacterium]
MSVGWDTVASVSSWQGLAPLDLDTRADVCVVGLGASGLAAVDALCARGLDVVGIDAGRVAGAAAGRNGGFLLAGAARPFHQAVSDWGVEAATGLYRQTLAEIDRLAEILGPAVVFRVGSIRLAGLPGPPKGPAEAEDRARELADCRAQAAALLKAGFAVETYHGPLGEGLYLPHDAAMNPAARSLALAGPLSTRARLYEGTRAASIRSGLVSTERAAVSAGAVIVAVDGGLAELLPTLSSRVRTARLQMLSSAPIDERRLPCPVYGRWGYDYAQQDGEGRVFVGGGRDLFAADEWTHDATPTAAVQAYVEQVARRMVGHAVSVSHRWAATVGYTDDGRALVTPVAEGVVACGGYSGTGNLVGPVAARAAVALVLDGTPPPAYFAS